MSAGPRKGSRITGHAQERLFLTREYEAIRGKHALVFWMLYAIVLVSLAAVAVGRTGLEHLRERMDDPFTSLVDIPATNRTVGENYPYLKNYLDSCAERGAFQALNSSGSYTMGSELWSTKDRSWNYVRSQSFGYWSDSSLLHAILDPSNVLQDLSAGDALSAGAYQDGVIVSAAVLPELGLNSNDLQHQRLLFRKGVHAFPVRVLAVVRTLPGKANVYCEHVFARGMADAEDKHILRPGSSNEATILLDTDDDTSEEELEAVRGELAELSGAKEVVISDDTSLVAYDHAARVVLHAMPSLKDLADLQKRLNENELCRRMAATVLYETNYMPPDQALVFGEWDPEDRYTLYDNLSITFGALDSIGAFQQDLALRFKVDLDLDRVRSKENFATITRLSEFLILALVLFAAMSILLFLYNLLKNHLERIKMNLGTFMAFGLSERFLFTGYMRIILKLLLRVMALAMVTLLAVQGLGWLLLRSGANVPDMLGRFDVLTNYWLYLTLSLLLAAAYVIFRWQLRSFLANTPGDLIYARK